MNWRTSYAKRLGQTRKGPTSRGSARIRNRLVPYLFLSPAILLFLCFVLLPFLWAIVLSFYEWDLLTPAHFAGVSNYKHMSADPRLYKALANTVIFTVASVVTHLAGGMALALGVNALRTRWLSYFVRTSVFFPFVISWAAVALLWKYVLDPSFGIVTYYLHTVGISAPNWFLDPAWALTAIIGIDFWHTIGFTFVIMLAGLQTIPKELHEAARCDGANAWQGFWKITLPLMSPTVFFASVVSFIGAFQIFDPMQIITPDGGPNNSTLSVVMYLYQEGFQAFRVGYASAVSVVIFLITMVVTILQFRGSRRWVHTT